MPTSCAKPHCSQLTVARPSPPTNSNSSPGPQTQAMQNYPMTAASMSWDPLGNQYHLLFALLSIASQPSAAAPAAPQAQHSCWGCTPSPFLWLLCTNAFIQLQQGRETVPYVMYATSGKAKASVRQGPCAIWLWDSSHTKTLCQVARQVGGLLVHGGGVRPIRNQRHPSPPVSMQQNLNMRIANTFLLSLQLYIFPNNIFYLPYFANILLQILISCNLYTEFHRGNLMECMPQLLYVCTVSKGLGDLTYYLISPNNSHILKPILNI